MRPHPRIRKTIKWGGAALTVLLVVVWIISWWRQPLIFQPAPYSSFSLTPGGVMYYSSDGRISTALFDARRATLAEGSELAWRGMWYTTSTSTLIHAPLWPAVLVLLCMTILAFRLDTLARRRTNMNLCTHCHYDRTGLPTHANCPECGQPPREQ